MIDQAKINIVKPKSYKKKALELFQSRIGKIVTSEDLAILTGSNGKPISHNIRRVFELRDEDGYEIVNHKDNSWTKLNLKVDEWVLLKPEPNPKKIRSRGVNKRIMYEVFSRDNFTCKFCGRTPQDDDPFKENHKIKLHVGHIIAHKKMEGEDFFKIENISELKESYILTSKDFLTMCNVCNEGAKNKDLKSISLKEVVLKAPIEKQHEILKALKEKFSNA